MVFCSVCFGDPTSPLTQGYNYGVLGLLALTLVVLFCFGKLFWDIYKRMNKKQEFSN